MGGGVKETCWKVWLASEADWIYVRDVYPHEGGMDEAVRVIERISKKRN